MNLAHLWIELLNSTLAISLGNIVLIAIGAMLIVVGALTRRYVYILLPMGFGLILGNFGAFNPNSPLGFLYSWGIGTGIFPLLAVAGLGAVTDFRPLLAQPRLMLAAVPVVVAVFASLVIAGILKFPLHSAVSIALAGPLTGPAAVYAANALSPDLVGPLGFASLLLPLLLFWSASRLSDAPLDSPPGMPPASEDEVARGFPATQLVFALVIAVGIGFFFRGALPLAIAFLLGNLFRSDQAGALLPSGLGWLLARSGLALTSLLVGASLTAGAFFTPQTLIALIVTLIGLVTCLVCFWVLLRGQISGGVLKLASLGGPSAVMGAAAAVELVVILLTCILITVANFIV
jgi:oxaloacetate decarboxylase beta subunit